MGAGITQVNSSLPIKQPKEKWLKAQRHLWRLFNQLRSEYTTWRPHKIPQDARLRKVFEKLNKRFNHYHDVSQDVIDPSLYMRAHFKFFGGKMFPSQLNSKCSFALYKTYIDIENMRVIPNSYNASMLEQAKMVRRLADIRNESEKQVMKQLKHSGLLSKKFLKSRGIS